MFSLRYSIRKFGIINGWRCWRLFRKNIGEVFQLLPWAEKLEEASVYLSEAGLNLEAGLLADMADEARRLYYTHYYERRGRNPDEAEGECLSVDIEKNNPWGV